MGFGTPQQAGNQNGINQASSGTSLADIFGGNIGEPKQLGQSQQSNQLFNLLQAVMNKSGGGAEPTPQPVQPDMPQPVRPGGGTPLSQFGSPGGPTSMSNPFGTLINQKFMR